MATDVKAWEDQLIAEMRANDGKVTQGPLAGNPLMIMTSTGAKSGESRRAILTYSEDAGDYIVAGTAGGAPTTPSWVFNVEAAPTVSIEVGNETFEANGEVIKQGPERDRLWAQHVVRLPWFAPYPEQSGRVIPMVRLKRTTRSARRGPRSGHRRRHLASRRSSSFDPGRRRERGPERAGTATGEARRR